VVAAEQVGVPGVPVLSTLAMTRSGSWSSTAIVASTLPSASAGASVTPTCLAGLSLASWIESDIARRFGALPGWSSGRLARTLSALKWTLPFTVTCASRLSLTFNVTTPPVSSCSGALTWAAA
jgi:hypothetical protein